MNKKLLESYRSNQRLIERNQKKIDDEECKEIPTVMGKVTGSSHEFPYIERRFTVQMDEPAEADKVYKRIAKLKKEIEKAEQEMDEVDRFISEIEDARDREIFIYRYIDGMKTTEIAKKFYYTKGRISQIISKYLED